VCGCRSTNDSRREDASRDDPSKHGSDLDAGVLVGDGIPPEATRAPELLYLPDGGDVVTGTELVKPAAPVASANARCPTEMVDVEGQFCIDRYEVQLVDQSSGELLSPYYPPNAARAKQLRAQWERQRGDCSVERGRTMPLPELARCQEEGNVEPVAQSNPHVVPSGYLDANTAERACKNAGKRLCKAEEWVKACRGQQRRQFPYGEQYVAGACNVFRESHPAQLLHGNASEGHLDPRLNQVTGEGGPLLRETGSLDRCKSEWGSDAIYDMVGNLDEWVDDEQGAFHGGFFSRATRLGCDARITTHPRQYLDYSLGVRCCK
jgi:formylglycine-generating enzyme required for sulfatase activity